MVKTPKLAILFLLLGLAAGQCGEAEFRLKDEPNSSANGLSFTVTVEPDHITMPVKNDDPLIGVRFILKITNLSPLPVLVNLFATPTVILETDSGFKYQTGVSRDVLKAAGPDDFTVVKPGKSTPLVISGMIYLHLGRSLLSYPMGDGGTGTIFDFVPGHYKVWLHYQAPKYPPELIPANNLHQNPWSGDVTAGPVDFTIDPPEK